MKPGLLVALLLALSLAGTATLRLGGGSAQQQADAPTVQRQLLRFADDADGSLAVLQASDGRLLHRAMPGEGGFLRSSLRGLVRERKRRGLGDEQPFELLARADGRLTLLDPATGRRIDLESFGATNAAVFARLLARSPA